MACYSPMLSIVSHGGTWNFARLGADAVRDGVDAPGDSLRLIVFDRVPWPRPDILHKARKSAFFRGAL